MKEMKAIWIKYRLLIPLGIISILCLQTIYKYLFKTQEYLGLTFDYYLSTKHYISFGVVALNWLVFFIYRPAFKFIFGATLIVGLCNLLNYTITTQWVTEKFYKGDRSIEFTFQPISLYLIILTYIICFQTVNRIMAKPFKLKPEEASKHKLKMQQTEINRFKERYSSYSDESLQTILEEKKYMSEALEAARLILDERIKQHDSL
jgi:hypothetical protein